MLHPLFNIVMRLNGYPSTYGVAAKEYPVLLKNKAHQSDFAKGLILTVRTIDGICAATPGYTAMAGDVEQALKGLGWL